MSEKKEKIYKQLDELTERIQNCEDMDELANLWDEEDKLRSKLEAIEGVKGKKLAMEELLDNIGIKKLRRNH